MHITYATLTSPERSICLAGSASKNNRPEAKWIVSMCRETVFVWVSPFRLFRNAEGKAVSEVRIDLREINMIIVTLLTRISKQLARKKR